MKMVLKVFISNYGCTANYDNGAIIAGLVKEEGYLIVKNTKEADIIIINSCAVKNVTVNKIFSQIESVKDKKLIITGCMPISENKKLSKYLKNGFALVSTQNIILIPEVIKKLLNNEQVILINKRKEIKLNLPKIDKYKKETSIQIAEGCKSFCTFCSTKFAKGDLVSYPKEEIIKEIKKYVSRGYKKINLTSTDNACYGFDLGYNLVDLLKEVIQIPGDFEIRVGMGNPEHTKRYLDDLIEIYKSPKIMKFIHIPVQSGSDKVLKEMKRKYSVKDFEYIASKFRKAIPEMTISTDIIVGYPTETEEDFNKTINLVKKVKPEVVHISKFASRPNTLASKLKPLDSRLIKERSMELTKVYLKARAEAIKIRKELVKNSSKLNYLHFHQL